MSIFILLVHEQYVYITSISFFIRDIGKGQVSAYMYLLRYGSYMSISIFVSKIKQMFTRIIFSANPDFLEVDMDKNRIFII